MSEETKPNRYGTPDYTDKSPVFYINYFAQKIIDKFPNEPENVIGVIDYLDLDMPDKARYFDLQDSIKRDLVNSRKLRLKISQSFPLERSTQMVITHPRRNDKKESEIRSSSRRFFENVFSAVVASLIVIAIVYIIKLYLRNP